MSTQERTFAPVSASVASVTIAYNAIRVLPRHLDALRRQTRPLDEIIVVDNASTDGTAELLASQYPQLTVLRLPENVGAGGAWKQGVAYAALSRRHDWVWTFDDDSVPGDDALEVLLATSSAALSTDGEIGLIAPLPIHEETGTCYPPLLWHEGFVKPSAEVLQGPFWFADLVFASGCMVRREVVEKIGLPRADFFMDFVDFEYCLRARKQGYKIGVVNRCKLSHEVGKVRKVQFFGYSALWPDHAAWREYYMSRNLAYSVWWLYPSRAAKWFAVRHLARHACGSLLFGSHKLACLRRMAQGFRDGRRATLGVRFRPS